MTSPPIRTFLYWLNSGSRFARLIAFASDGPWSHMGGGFELEDGTIERFEALKHQGFNGPKPMQSLLDFVQSDPKRRMAIEYTDLDAEQSVIARDRCKSMVGKVAYGELQLALMGLSERYFLPVPTTRGVTVCSEAWSRILEPWVDLRDRRRHKHDMVNPNSAWRRFLEIKGGYSELNAAPATAA